MLTSKLKMNEIIILSYIYKYNRIDLYTLYRILNAPLVSIADSIARLYENGHIFLKDNDKVFVSKNIPIHLIDSFDEWTLKYTEKNIIDKDSFEWDYLYIPLRFMSEYGE